MYTDRVKNMEDIQICYLENSNEPILICNARVFGASNLYNNYKSREDLEEKCKKDDMDKNISFGKSESNLIAEILINSKIENGAQIVEFINYVYGPKSDTLKALLSSQHMFLIKLFWVYFGNIHSVLTILWLWGSTNG